MFCVLELQEVILKIDTSKTNRTFSRIKVMILFDKKCNVKEIINAFVEMFFNIKTKCTHKHTHIYTYMGKFSGLVKVVRRCL